MKWQWKLGKFAGIDVYVHATFLLLIGWVGYSHWLENRNLGEVFSGVLFILALFACVILHEYGHALTARKYGIKTRDITIYPIGGVARLERMPEKPIEELWVALMGPAVNVVIAAGLFAYLFWTSSLVPLNELTIASGSFLERLMIVNISLVLFNLIPAYPITLLDRKLLVSEKLDALLDRGKSRDFFDLYFILRNNELRPLINFTSDKRKAVLDLIKHRPAKTLSRELRLLLPKDFRGIIADLPAAIGRELSRFT